MVLRFKLLIQVTIARFERINREIDAGHVLVLLGGESLGDTLQIMPIKYALWW